MLRRTLSSALLGLGVLGGAAIAATPAYAASTCVLIPPARVVVNSPEVDLTGTVSGSCTTESGIEAYWYSKRTNEELGGYAEFYSPGRSADVYFYDDEIEYGVNQWSGDAICRETTVKKKTSCVDADDYTQGAANTSDIRAFSTAGVVARRSHRTVALTGSSAAYSLIAHKQARRSAPAYWQYQDKTTVPFRTFRTVTTTSAGATTVTVQGQPAKRRYRLLLGSTPTSWSSVSRTVTP